LRTNLAASKPVGAGVALLDGVADGLGGALVTMVGVGTGGSVRTGSGDSETVTEAVGAAELGDTTAGDASTEDPPAVRGGFDA
jgi:hypothetical protein